MSDIIRTTAPPEFARYTTRELAALSHDAEDTEDDILLLQVDNEVMRRERRVPGAHWMYMEHYRQQMCERAAKLRAKGAT